MLNQLRLCARLGSPAITGAIVSCTMTLKPDCAALLCASGALQCTAVEPSGKVLPDGGLQVTATLPSTRSVAVGAA